MRGTTGRGGQFRSPTSCTLDFVRDDAKGTFDMPKRGAKIKLSSE
jgi:hypothetical protein